jgi:excinuclease ABC subunit A
MTSGNAIRIRGARVHNLKGIDVDIPRDRLTVITGVSGSGKSSLAFDTLYAEGQRQYIESLSAYARQFLDQLPRPDVEWVDGLEPTLCIDQKPGATNPRSTVGTVTEVYDYLRLLYARAGIPHCYSCGRPILQLSTEQIVASLAGFPEGTKVMVLAPMVRGRKGAHQEVFAEIRKAGFVRVRVDGEILPLDEVLPLEVRKNHSIDAIVDRIVWRAESESRLADSVRLALKLGNGLVTLTHQQPTSAQWSEKVYSTLYACPDCDISYEELEPRTFSFNSPYGACPHCDGMGRREQFDVDLVLPEVARKLAISAHPLWKGTAAKLRQYYREPIERFLEANKSTWETPFCELTKSLLQKLIHGDKQFPGIVTLLESEWSRNPVEKRQTFLASLRTTQTCDQCGGGRLRHEALTVEVGGKNIQQTTAMTIGEAASHFQNLHLDDWQKAIAKPLLAEITKRLRFLLHVGVHYLTLDRSSDSLSGGELQRVRLATSIGSGLVGVCYVLDEPSIGLHQRDNDLLIEAIRQLQGVGNTVIVVEHDEAMMRAADWIIDMGPGAGELGGQIIAAGTPQELTKNPASQTGPFLSGEKKVERDSPCRLPDPERILRLKGASTNNLKQVDLELPLGLLVGITGVSGSGKSSLINDTLYPAVARNLGLVAAKPGPYTSLSGMESVEKLLQIDQSPIGRSPRSCPATYTGVFDEIRKVFAATREAKQRGFTASRFSFNASAGRCVQCQGQGQEKIEMNFLSDLEVLCSMCQGKRFNQQTLRIRYKGVSIADVLEMSVVDAAEFFAHFAKIDRYLQSMVAVGLGYLRLGQSSTSLSGGEAQRLKLATELAKAESGKTLYLLDEPTTGLHFEDVARLLRVLDSLADRGNTVVVIEHNLDVARACDWLVDLGPEGGSGGGTILAAGSPAALRENPKSVTGRYL